MMPDCNIRLLDCQKILESIVGIERHLGSGITQEPHRPTRHVAARLIPDAQLPLDQSLSCTM